MLLITKRPCAAPRCRRRGPSPFRKKTQVPQTWVSPAVGWIKLKSDGSGISYTKPRSHARKFSFKEVEMEKAHRLDSRPACSVNAPIPDMSITEPRTSALLFRGPFVCILGCGAVGTPWGGRGSCQSVGHLKFSYDQMLESRCDRVRQSTN